MNYGLNKNLIIQNEEQKRFKMYFGFLIEKYWFSVQNEK